MRKGFWELDLLEREGGSNRRYAGPFRPDQN
jgi:hypothetical protein